MNSGKQIRVIKSAQREMHSAEERHPAKNRSSRLTNREMAGHVAGWIDDLRQRHREDARRSFASLFVEPITQP